MEPGKEQALGAREAVLAGIQAAEAVLDAIMEKVVNRRSREEISRAIEAYIRAHGEPRFTIACSRCREKVVDWTLVYLNARGLWSWMPPGYLLAQFNGDETARRCPACGFTFPPVEF